MFDFELYGLYRKRWSNRLATQPSVWKSERTQYQRMLQNGFVEDFFLLMLELPDVFMSFFQPDSAGQLELCKQIDVSTSNKRELARLFMQLGSDCASYASLLESSLFDRFLLDAYGLCNTLTQQEVQFWRKIVSRMALIEGGRFYMSPYPSYRDSVEYRGIVVHITRSFLISRYPVTQMLWQYVMGDNPSVHKGATRPVGNISWFEAIGFCNALSRMEGFEAAYSIHDQKVSLNRWSRGYRLPSEAEWEYAARARPFPPLIDCLYATYPDLFQKLPRTGVKKVLFERLNRISSLGSSEAEAAVEQFLRVTQGALPYVMRAHALDGDSAHENSGVDIHPVGQREPNRHGLYDLNGNVEEWCFDSWSFRRLRRTESGYRQTEHLDRIVYDPTSRFRVLRGGGCATIPARAGIFERSFRPSLFRCDGIGLRLVRWVDERPALPYSMSNVS